MEYLYMILFIYCFFSIIAACGCIPMIFYEKKSIRTFSFIMVLCLPLFMAGANYALEKGHEIRENQKSITKGK